MRKPLIAGNWKMNLDRAKRSNWDGPWPRRPTRSPMQIWPCSRPASISTPSVSAIRGSKLGLGAQNLYHEAPGAFTGEVCAAMLVDLGCQYVILGHSERRHILHETDTHINKKVHEALAAKLLPIVCVGELLAEREAGQTQTVINTQFQGSLAGLSAEQFASVIIAYEPVWAIGTGKVATPEQAEEVHSDLRKIVERRYNATVAQAVRILYGGSVKPSNAAELLGQPDVDGALVGGASLKAADFLGIAAGVGA